MNHKWKAVGLIFLLFLSVLFPTDGMKVGDNRRAEPEQISTQAASERPAEELNTEVSTEVIAGPAEEDPETEAESELAKKYEQAEKILAEMTLEEKVAQMFLVCCRKDETAREASGYHVGGILLFAASFKNRNPETALAFTEELQGNADIPFLMAVDEEGGTVVRISRYPAFRAEKFMAPGELYETGGYDKIREDTIQKCELLTSIGINVNMAPVCDVSGDSSDFIYERALGEDAEKTAEYIEIVVKEMKNAKMGIVLKHFPGYGNNGDTHKGIMYDERSMDVFESEDFLPFQSGIAEGADAVLVSHTIVKCMDEEYPASLSKEVHDILREKLKFEGVILTDDLDMDAITEYTDGRSAAVQAVLAGNDMLCCGDYKNQIPAVVEAVEEGTIDEAQIDESVLRILIWKMNLGLIPEES